MSSDAFVLLCFQLTVMLSVAVVFGQLMRRLGQPSVLGEMLGGILLGPTCFGTLAPHLYHWLFQSSVEILAVREAIIKLGMLFFLFVTGLQINLSDLKRFGREATSIGLIGTFLPIVIGASLVYCLPRAFWGMPAQFSLLPFALFIGINFANSANPVLARILIDLDLIKTKIGAISMTATVMDDLVNWILFAIILNTIIPGEEAARYSLASNIASVLIFVIAILLLGRWLRYHAYGWVKNHVSWPVGFIAATTVAILFIGGIAERLGIHAFLGAFLIGVGLGWGDDPEGSKQIRDIITQFSLSFFAPLYFVSMGLTINFITNFDLPLVVVIILAASVIKIGSVILGARAGGMRLNQEVMAIGFGLNARGATGVILAAIGFGYRLIDERIFVAMVTMAILTSLVSGPMIKYLLKTMRVAHH